MSNGPLGSGVAQTGLSRSMNNVVEPVASVIVSVVFAPQEVGQVPPVIVTLLMRMIWLSRSSRKVLKLIVESLTCLQVRTIGSMAPKFPVEWVVTSVAFPISVRPLKWSI